MSEREQFEAWAKEFSPSTPLWTDNQGQYVYWFSEWVAWQAARAQSSSANPVEVGTTVQAGQVLSDAEIVACRKAQVGRYGTVDPTKPYSDSIAFGRAIEAAVLAKRVPMTDAQIEHALRAEPMADSEESFALGIRHAERHHGIVGKEGA